MSEQPRKPSARAIAAEAWLLQRLVHGQEHELGCGCWDCVFALQRDVVKSNANRQTALKLQRLRDKARREFYGRK